MSNVVLKTLEFSNMFSYAKNNKITLNGNRLTQLTAVNGCLSGNTTIVDNLDISRTLKEIVQNKMDLTLIGVNENNEPVETKIVDWFNNGTKPLFRVTFENGTTLDLTECHLLKTLNGWVPLYSLKPGDYIINPRHSIHYKETWEYDIIPYAHVPGLPKSEYRGITRKAYPKLVNSGRISPIPNINNISFVEIENIIPFEYDLTYDITTTTGNFIADGILVHNSGKTSIALILQELLYNKNIKGIKKGDILNRHIEDKNWNAKLTFSVDRVPYALEVKRAGAKSEVTLLENNVNISEHKILDTYKKLQDILGMNFETFSQLTYQSSTDLLDFLKATDTNRKKFLISLFNLEKYIQIGEKVKSASTTVERELNKLEGELRSIDNFLNNTTIPDLKNLVSVPEVENSIIEEITLLNQELEQYNSICKRIDKNNMYIEERNELQFNPSMQYPEEEHYQDEINELIAEKNSISRQLKSINNNLNNIDTKSNCPTCGQPIDNSHAVKMKKDLLVQKEELENKVPGITSKYNDLSNKQKIYNNKLGEYNNNQKALDRFEQLSHLIDENTPTEYPNFNDITNKRDELLEVNKQEKQAQTKAIGYNQQVGIHNAKVEALVEQKNTFLSRQTVLKQDIITLTQKINNLTILKKAFSTSGIVAFKLENLTKELEDSINQYLSLLSDGQFQVTFKLDNEKLNIVVISSTKEVAIETVSGGEFSRIQTAILLAIRSLLSKLGGNSINLLFLDEIFAVLDDEGKDKLVEVLQKEHDLNIFLVSHEYEHPLIPKLEIVKQNNISYIQ